MFSSLLTRAKKTFCLAVAASAALFAGTAYGDQDPSVGVVNFRKCLEESKLGKEERSKFDDLRRQMEAIGEAKETALQELTSKFNDPDYIDGLSPEAEAKAKEEYRQLTQELAQLQQHYYQILNQANMRILQHIMDEVSSAATEVAKNRSLSLVLNEESSFFHVDALDISEQVISILDERIEEGKISACDLEKEFPVAR